MIMPAGSRCRSICSSTSRSTSSDCGRWSRARTSRSSLDSAGRLWSPALGVGFGWQDDGRLVRVLRSDGTVVPTRSEMAAQANELAAEVERLRRALREEG